MSEYSTSLVATWRAGLKAAYPGVKNATKINLMSPEDLQRAYANLKQKVK